MTVSGRAIAQQDFIFQFVNVFDNVGTCQVSIVLLYGQFPSINLNFERVAPLTGATHVNGLQPIWHKRPDVGDVTFLWVENLLVI